MPPRPSKSPARTVSPKPEKPPAKSKSPVTPKTPAAPPKAKPKATPKSGKKVEKEPATNGGNGNGNGDATTAPAAPAPTPASAAPKPAPTPAPKPKVPEAALAGGFFAVLLGLLAVLFAYSSAKPEPIGWVSSKSFDGTTLKMKEASSALLIFMTRLEECEPCADLKKELSDTAFLSAAAGWKKSKLLKVGKVKCWKNEQLCRDFGVAGDDETAKGYPHILHFKGGKAVAPVLPRTAGGLSAWVFEKQAKGEL